MTQKISYKFILRAPGEDPLLVIHETKPGDAEECARRMAGIVARKYGYSEVRCVWKGPADEKIPPKIREELRRERVS